MTTITSDDIAAHFLEQYRKWKDNGYVLDEMAFTSEQMTALIHGIQDDPDEMIHFFHSAMMQVIATTLNDTDNDYTETINKLAQWSQTIISFLIPQITLLSKSPEELEELRQHYEDVKLLTELDDDNPFKTLDFSIPDINNIKLNTDDD